MWQEHESGSYPSIGLCWDPGVRTDPPWEYMSQCETALKAFDEAVDWSAIEPEVVRRELKIEDEDEESDEEENHRASADPVGGDTREIAQRDPPRVLAEDKTSCVEAYEHESKPHMRSRILRWVAFLPAAVTGGYLAYLIGGFVNRVGFMWAYGRPATGWQATVLDVMGHLYMGSAAIYVGARVAPSHQKLAAGSIAGLSLLIAGAAALATVLEGRYVDLLAIGGFVAGSLLVAIPILTRGLTAVR